MKSMMMKKNLMKMWQGDKARTIHGAVDSVMIAEKL
jgi:hypothetical protein